MTKRDNIIDVMQNTLDHVDPKLTNHGKRVAYLVFQLLRQQDKYTEKEMRDICILAMLHDVGAYKTEEIEKMVLFETVNVWEHSIYGYLFLKYFSPLEKMAPVILGHHAHCHELQHIPPACRELAQIIFLCDRADIYAHTVGPDGAGFRRTIEKLRDVQFRSDIVDLFFSSEIDLRALDKGPECDEDFLRALYGLPLSESEANAYIKMTVLSIDFRSYHTVIHTIATTCVARTVAALLGLDERELAQIEKGAMLHDIGKTGIPIGILENPGRLSDAEMETMRSHVVATDRIISGNVAEEVRRIAVRHHEKLDGSGYPEGLREADLSTAERIVAIADIFSALSGVRSYKGAYPKEKIVGILEDMSAQGLLDTEIVRLSAERFDDIAERLRQECEPIIELYDRVDTEYRQWMDRIRQWDGDVRRAPAQSTSGKVAPALRG